LSINRYLFAVILAAACSPVSYAAQKNKFFEAPSNSPLDRLQAQKELSLSDAQALVDSGEPLILEVTTLDEDVAEVLAQSSCRALSLRQVPVISKPAAVAIASWSGGESRTGLFAGIKGRLHLGLSEISDDVAEALSQAQCTMLELGNAAGKAIPKLSVKAANSLSRYQGNLTLHVELLPVWGEWAFADSGAALRLPRLRSIASSRLLKKLVADADGHFEIGLETLHAEEAVIIAEQELQTLRLPGIKNLSPEVAEILANAKARQISLMGLKDCPPDVRSVLERNKGVSLP
jgi:hypothetical protein